MFTGLFKNKLFFYFLFLILFTGCGIWQNFTTYFNLYYNASTLYDKSEEQILLQKKELFSTESPVIPASVNTDLQKVIEKCSNILQFSYETAYVDEALMILGKSFYYQKNYLKSRRKFEELISSQPESEYILEAKLWIGKCEMRLKNYPEGLAALSEVRRTASEEGEDEILQDAFIEEIVYRKTINDIPGAIQSANELLEQSDNDEIKAEVWYEVGNLNLQVNNLQEAVTAYKNVFDYSPKYELEVDSKLKLGKALRDIGEAEEALSLFEDMNSEDKYAEKYSDIELEIGKTHSVLGNYNEAINKLIYVDTTYKNSTNSGAAKFELAKIYEKGFNRLDSAAIYYQKASASTLPKEYIDQAKEKNRLFSRYITLINQQGKYSKQLFYLTNPEELVKDSITYVQDSLAISKEIANVKELQEIWSGLDSLLVQRQDTTGYYQDSITVANLLVTFYQDSLENFTRDTVLTRVRHPQINDSILVAKFDSMLTNRTFDPEGRTKIEQQKREQENVTRQLVAGLPDTLKYKNNPPRKPKISEDSLKTLLAKNQLELGNLFLTELNFPDSAFMYYKSNLTDYPDNQYYATSMFALGSYYLTVDDTTASDSLFNIIYDSYKHESIVNAAAEKLNKPFIDLHYDPAKEIYIQAENLLLYGEFNSAIEYLIDIPEDYPNSPLAPKALYACGWIEENELKNIETAAQYYDTLIARYPASEFVRSVAPKVSVYKQEKRKLEKAREDSLKALVQIDSLAADTSLVIEEEEIPNDTVQVAVSEEQTPVQIEKKIDMNEKKAPMTKEPIWNPRKRR